MKAGEIRIGNLVKEFRYGSGTKPVSFSIIKIKDGIGINNACNYEPIELSAEKAVNWLGFKEQNGMYFLPINVGLTLCYLPDKNILQLAIGNRALNYSNPKVHQVQNLFYTFTGKELEVTLPS